MLIPENREKHKKRSLSVSRYLREIRRPEVVTSETLVLAALLAFVGGYQDAYSFIGRQRVFANAQTGNLILLGVNAVSGNLEGFIRYLIPVSCFTLGILAACILRSRVGNGRFLHWRQRVLILEMLLLSVNLQPHFPLLCHPGGDLQALPGTSGSHHHVHREPEKRHGESLCLH